MALSVDSLDCLNVSPSKATSQLYYGTLACYLIKCTWALCALLVKLDNAATGHDTSIVTITEIIFIHIHVTPAQR